MSHSWPKSEPPILNRHHFGVRIFTFGWRSPFLGISVMQTTRLMQDFPDPNLLQENCARAQKKKGTKYEKRNPEMKSSPRRLLASNYSRFIAETGTTGYLTQQETYASSTHIFLLFFKGTACKLKMTMIWVFFLTEADLFIIFLSFFFKCKHNTYLNCCMARCD